MEPSVRLRTTLQGDTWQTQWRWGVSTMTVDLLVANSNNSGLLLGNGDGTFQAAQSYNVGGPSVAVGDFNHDGRPDAALAGTVVLLNITHRSK